MDASAADVVVVGNGPVGQTAALLLARWGLDVVVLDARPGRDRAGSRSICQQRDVLDIWDSVGVGRAIADAGVTWRTARTYLGDRELFAFEYVDAGRSPFPPWVNVPQWRTEELLDEAIAAEPRITVAWSHRVQQIDPGTADGSLPATVVASSPDGRVGVRAPYVVVCAGSRCDDLRTALGVTLSGPSFDDRFLICDIRTDLPDWATERRFYFDPAWNPGRQVLIHACPDSVFRIDWQVPADFDLEAEERSGGLDTRIRQVVGDRPYELVWRSVYRFASKIVDRFAVGNILLAGDAAHVMAPFGARGLNSGVQDAENAAWKIAFVRRGWAPPDLIATYAAERRAAALENLDVTGATMRFLAPPDATARDERTAILARARDDAAARAHVDSGRLAEPYWYPDSPLSTPDPRRPKPVRPPRGSMPAMAPGVLVPDLPVVDPTSGARRLRELCRSGLLVLVGRDADIGAVRAVAGVAAPVRVASLDGLSPDGVLSSALSSDREDVWVIRPDGHVAAVLHRPDRQAVERAVARCLGASGPPVGGQGIRQWET